jgi:hypothetical protein
MFEINPRHPLIKELLRVEDNPADKSASDMTMMMYITQPHSGRKSFHLRR